MLDDYLIPKYQNLAVVIPPQKDPPCQTHSVFAEKAKSKMLVQVILNTITSNYAYLDRI